MTRRDRRVLWLGCLAVVAIVTLGRGLPRYRAFVRGSDERVWALRHRLAASTRALERRPEVAQALVAARQAYLALAPRLIPGSAPAEAAGALLAVVSGAAARPGLSVTGIQATADSVAGAVFRRVTVRGSLTGDIAGVVEFLRALETGPARLVVRELAIDQPDVAAPGDRAESLHVRFAVEGLVLRREATP